jgi:hypothetical protein
VESLIQTVRARKSIAKFIINLNIQLDEYNVEDYPHLFVETTKGARLLDSLVPGRKQFTTFVRSLSAVRIKDSAEFSLKVDIGADIESEEFPLMVATYDSPVSCADLGQMSSNPPPIDKSRITYTSNRKNHRRMKRNLVDQYANPDYGYI